MFIKEGYTFRGYNPFSFVDYDQGFLYVEKFSLQEKDIVDVTDIHSGMKRKISFKYCRRGKR